MTWTNRSFPRSERPALVLLSDRAESPLWDPELGALVEDLEDRLGGVHVTHAVIGGEHPTPADALVAVELMGASAAVVAPAAASSVALTA